MCMMLTVHYHTVSTFCVPLRPGQARLPLNIITLQALLSAITQNPKISAGHR